jgi:hypothetical protein
MMFVCMLYSLSFIRMWTEKDDRKELYFVIEGVTNVVCVLFGTGKGRTNQGR